MRLIITGALGHIGSRLIRTLASTFDRPEIIMIDDLSTQRYCSLFDLPDNAIYQFIEERVQTCNLDNIVAGSNAVVHLAATTDAASTAHQPQIVYNNNFFATQHIAQSCLKNKVPIIFPSSTSVYGSQSHLVDEECKELQPQSPYAETKIKEENYLKSLEKQGLKMIICRFGTIYGASRGMRFHTAVNKFCWQALMRQILTVWETAMDQKRPYLSLEDAVNAVVWIIQNHLYPGEVYNIVSGNYTVRNVIDEIKKRTGPINISLVQHKIMNQFSYEASNQKFIKTGFNFKGELEEGISETLNLLKNANMQV